MKKLLTAILATTLALAPLTTHANDDPLKPKHDSEQQLKEAQTNLTQTKETLSNLEQLDELLTSEESLDTTLNTLTSEVDHLTNDVNQATANQAKANEDLALKQQEFDIASKEADPTSKEHQAKLQALNEEKDALDKTIQDTTASIAEKEEAIKTATNEQTALQESYNTAKQELDTLKETVEQTEEYRALQEKKEPLDQARNELETLQASIQETNTNIATLESEQTTKNEEKQTLEETLATLQEDLTNAQASGNNELVIGNAEEVEAYKKEGALGFFKYQAKNNPKAKGFEMAASLFTTNPTTPSNVGPQKGNKSTMSHDQLLALVDFNDPNNAVSFENFKNSVAIIKESNTYRQSCNANLPILTVDPVLMATSILTINSCPAKEKLAHAKTFVVFQNIAWHLNLHNTFYKEKNSWVTAEKRDYDALVAANKLKESDRYTTLNGTQFGKKVEHYVNLNYNKLKTSGAAINSTNIQNSNNNYYCQDFFFNPIAGKNTTFTVEEFEQLIADYETYINNPIETKPTAEYIQEKINETTTKLNDVTTRLQTIETDLTTLNQTLATLTPQVEPKQQAIEPFQEAYNQELESFNAVHGNTLTQKMEQLDQTKQQLTTLETSIKQTTQEVKTLNQTLRQANDQQTTLTANLENLTTNLENAKQQAQQNLEQAKTTATQATNTLNNLQATLANKQETKTQLTTLKTQLATLKQAKDAYDATHIAYIMLEGMDATQNTTTQTNTLKFRSSADLSKFARVLVDNNVVDPSNYTTESGSTIVYLKHSYLQTLSVGQHKIEIESIDGSVSTNFTIEKTKTITSQKATKQTTTPINKNLTNNTIPSTNDNSNLLFYTTLFVLTTLTLITTFKKLKNSHN